MENEVDNRIDVLIIPSEWNCFGEDDCSTKIMESCWRDNPVLCIGCSQVAVAEFAKRREEEIQNAKCV